MRYMTVKEASEKWEISTRRVCILCKNGRILGAVKRSKIWMIPSDAKKPEDARVNDSQNILNLCTLIFNPDYATDRTNIVLSKEENSICEIQKKFFSGQFEEAYFGVSILLDMEKCDNIIFYLTFLKMVIAADLGKKEEYLNALTRIELIRNRSNISDIEKELLDYYMGVTDRLNSELFHGEQYEELMPLISIISAKKGLNELAKNGAVANISNFEIICGELENKNCPLMCAYYHIYLAVYSNAAGEKSSYIYHINRAVDILLPRGWYTPLAEYSATIDLSFIKQIDAKAYREIEKLSKKIIDNYVKIGIFDCLTANPRMDKAINVQIGFKIVQGKTNEEIAEELGISLYKVKQHLNDLSDVVGSSFKKDIKQFVLRNFVL